VLTGLAHTAICVPDIDAAIRWYTEVLGLRLLSPPYRMEGRQIELDMGELVPPPVVVTAAIVGFEREDRVLELIEYPMAEAPGPPRSDDRRGLTEPGITHIGILCDELTETRALLEARGVEFLTSGIADVAGLRTTWCQDPWGTLLILLQKRRVERPYWGQLLPPE
jgi:catechol 2,3-dioxygenase-like lactoylglutathione lyase family enzyme